MLLVGAVVVGVVLLGVVLLGVLFLLLLLCQCLAHELDGFVKAGE